MNYLTPLEIFKDTYISPLKKEVKLNGRGLLLWPVNKG